MFADSFVVYASHGTLVPPDMVHGQPWSVARILAERNVEVRRCAAEQMGWERFLAEADATLIAEVPTRATIRTPCSSTNCPRKMHPNFPRGCRCACAPMVPTSVMALDGDTASSLRATLTIRSQRSPKTGVPASVYRQLQVRR